MAAILTWYDGNAMTVSHTLDAASVTMTGTLLTTADVTVWTGALTEGATVSGTTTYSATVNPGDLLVAITVGQTLKLRTVGTVGGVPKFKKTERVAVEERGGDD